MGFFDALFGGKPEVRATYEAVTKSVSQTVLKAAAECTSSTQLKNILKFQAKKDITITDTKIEQKNVAVVNSDCLAKALSDSNTQKKLIDDIKKNIVAEDSSFAGIGGGANVNADTKIKKFVNSAFSQENLSKCKNLIELANEQSYISEDGNIKIAGSQLVQSNSVKALLKCVLTSSQSTKDIVEIANTSSTGVKHSVSTLGLDADKIIGTVGKTIDNAVDEVGSVVKKGIDAVQGVLSTGVIAGAAIGGIILLIIVGLGIYVGVQGSKKGPVFGVPYDKWSSKLK